MYTHLTQATPEGRAGVWAPQKWVPVAGHPEGAEGAPRVPGPTNHPLGLDGRLWGLSLAPLWTYPRQPPYRHLLPGVSPLPQGTPAPHHPRSPQLPLAGSGAAHTPCMGRLPRCVSSVHAGQVLSSDIRCPVHFPLPQHQSTSSLHPIPAGVPSCSCLTKANFSTLWPVLDQRQSALALAAPLSRVPWHGHVCTCRCLSAVRLVCASVLCISQSCGLVHLASRSLVARARLRRTREAPPTLSVANSSPAGGHPGSGPRSKKECPPHKPEQWEDRSAPRTTPAGSRPARKGVHPGTAQPLGFQKRLSTVSSQMTRLYFQG